MAEFALVMEDMRAKPKPPFVCLGGRVLDKPLRHRYLEVGQMVISVEICYHGRSLDHPCGLCGYEYERLGER
jgi:hypothetical protein